MIKRRLKYSSLLLFIGILVGIPLLTIFTLVKTNLKEELTAIDPEYVAEEIIENSLPVINETTKVINPYVDPEVKIGKTYYDYKGEESSQINSIILHDDTYIQNTGVDYVGEKVFDVVAVLDGTVLNIKEDDTVGKVIEIKHKDGYISIYQSLGEINVKKGDIITQGQVIGTSGTNELDKDLGNHLHFEVYNNGTSINPETYLNTEVSLKEEN